MICSLCKTYALEYVGSRMVGLDETAIWRCIGCFKEEYDCLCPLERAKKIFPSVVFK